MTEERENSRGDEQLRTIYINRASSVTMKLIQQAVICPLEHPESEKSTVFVRSIIISSFDISFRLMGTRKIRSRLRDTESVKTSQKPSQVWREHLLRAAITTCNLFRHAFS